MLLVPLIISPLPGDSLLYNCGRHNVACAINSIPPARWFPCWSNCTTVAATMLLVPLILSPLSGGSLVAATVQLWQPQFSSCVHVAHCSTHLQSRHLLQQVRSRYSEFKVHGANFIVSCDILTLCHTCTCHMLSHYATPCHPASSHVVTLCHSVSHHATLRHHTTGPDQGAVVHRACCSQHLVG